MKEIKITDIKGIKVGNAQSFKGGTGCTAIICEAGAFAGVDVRGGAPASRETELLKPVNTVKQIHCVMLSGGSAFGLAACDGAMQYLEEKKIGFDVGIGVVPIVCGASLFDLILGDPKKRPDKKMGHEACKAAEKGEPAQGNEGAGTGASVGKFLGTERMMKSGLGIYAVQLGKIKCGVVTAVNSLGDIIDYDTKKIIAGILSEDRKSLSCTKKIMYQEIERSRNVFAGNTSIGCVVTNAKLDKDQACKLASIAHNGYARTIDPVHTTADGDTIFVMSTGEEKAAFDPLSALVSEVTGRAVNNAVKNAKPAYGLPAACDFI